MKQGRKEVISDNFYVHLSFIILLVVLFLFVNSKFNLTGNIITGKVITTIEVEGNSDFATASLAIPSSDNGQNLETNKIYNISLILNIGKEVEGGTLLGIVTDLGLEIISINPVWGVSRDNFALWTLEKQDSIPIEISVRANLPGEYFIGAVWASSSPDDSGEIRSEILIGTSEGETYCGNGVCEDTRETEYNCEDCVEKNITFISEPKLKTSCSVEELNSEARNWVFGGFENQNLLDLLKRF